MTTDECIHDHPTLNTRKQIAVKTVAGREYYSVADFASEFTPEGWITRAGNFLSCSIEMLHGHMAQLALGGDANTAELRAEKLGWVRLSNYGDRTCKPLNQAQLNALFDYCEAMNLDYKETLNGIKLL